MFVLKSHVEIWDSHNGVVAYENAICGFVCNVCFSPAVQTTEGADSSVNDCIMP